MIFPYHRQMEIASEAARGASKIGTTSRGIGPAYEDKMARHGLRVCDLMEPERFREKLEQVICRKNAICRSAYGTELDVEGLADKYLALCGAAAALRGGHDGAAQRRFGRRAGRCFSRARKARCWTSISGRILS